MSQRKSYLPAEIAIFYVSRNLVGKNIFLSLRNFYLYPLIAVFLREAREVYNTCSSGLIHYRNN